MISAGVRHLLLILRTFLCHLDWQKVDSHLVPAEAPPSTVDHNLRRGYRLGFRFHSPGLLMQTSLLFGQHEQIFWETSVAALGCPAILFFRWCRVRFSLFVAPWAKSILATISLRPPRIAIFA